eukprot:6547772-Prymnesium_polylepis.1
MLRMPDAKCHRRWCPVGMLIMPPPTPHVCGRRWRSWRPNMACLRVAPPITAPLTSRDLAQN